MSLLPIVQPPIDTEEKFKAMLPDRDTLTRWQQCQYDQMVKMWRAHVEGQGIYHWPKQGEPYHDGVLSDVFFRGERLLRASEDGVKTNCCGVTFQHFLESWRAAMEELDLYETDKDVPLDIMEEARGYFFLYKDAEQYWDGGGRGLAYVWRAFATDQAKLSSAQEKLGVSQSFYTEDPTRAQFGDYLQFQNKPSPIESDSGHSAIFVGLEEREYNGSLIQVIRAFNSNVRNDYGMSPGVGFCWYMIGKKDRDTGFVRRCKFGGLRGA